MQIPVTLVQGFRISGQTLELRVSRPDQPAGTVKLKGCRRRVGRRMQDTVFQHYGNGRREALAKHRIRRALRDGIPVAMLFYREGIVAVLCIHPFSQINPAILISSGASDQCDRSYDDKNTQMFQSNLPFIKSVNALRRDLVWIISGHFRF